MMKSALEKNVEHTDTNDIYDTPFLADQLFPGPGA